MIKHTTTSLLLCITVYIASISIASGSGMVKLQDYENAQKARDNTKIALLKSYILGAVETHLLYSVMLEDVMGGTLYCTGDIDLNINNY